MGGQRRINASQEPMSWVISSANMEIQLNCKDEQRDRLFPPSCCPGLFLLYLAHNCGLCVYPSCTWGSDRNFFRVLLNRMGDPLGTVFRLSSATRKDFLSTWPSCSKMQLSAHH